MISSSMPAIACPPPRTTRYSLALGHLARLVSGREHHRHHVARRRLLRHRRPGRALIAQLLDLLAARCRRSPTTPVRVHAEALRCARASTSGRTSTWSSNVSGWPSSNLTSWTCGCEATFRFSRSITSLIRFLKQRLERLLPDGVVEALAHHRRGRLAWPETGEPDRRRVPFRGALLGLLHGVGWYRDFEEPFDAVALLGRDLDVHRPRNLNGDTSAPAKKGKGWSAERPTPLVSIDLRDYYRPSGNM